jgi:hypothetical protein
MSRLFAFLCAICIIFGFYGTAAVAALAAIDYMFTDFAKKLKEDKLLEKS